MPTVPTWHVCTGGTFPLRTFTTGARSPSPLLPAKPTTSRAAGVAASTRVPTAHLTYYIPPSTTPVPSLLRLRPPMPRSSTGRSRASSSTAARRDSPTTSATPTTSRLTASSMSSWARARTASAPARCTSCRTGSGPTTARFSSKAATATSMAPSGRCPTSRRSQTAATSSHARRRTPVPACARSAG